MSDKTYLFRAEVNHIQDTLFAAGLQRQVVGGSRLLAVFTEEAAEKIAPEYGSQQVIVKAGGNFRIIFDDHDKAKAFGEYIANAYHLLLDGVMTILDPIPFEDRGEENCLPSKLACKETLCFTCANDALEKKMRAAKRKRPFYTTTPHVPTNAICQSSGTQPAEFWKPLEGEAEYMSGPAYRMKEVGHVEKKGGTSPDQDDEKEGFLEKIRRTIPESKYHHQRWAKRPEELAEWDATQSNIAYLVADGNNMGKYFRQCRTPKQHQLLSEALQQVVYEAIAAPIPKLAENLFGSYLGNEKATYLPLLPLIAAGDDVFIMLPAPYALAYAQEFCLEFSAKMKRAIEEMGLKTDLPPITMSAGVVICKQSYPYLLAHQFGERLLGQTKQVVKTAGPKFGWHSAISFDVIIGSVGSNGRSYTGDYRPTLGTYWANNVENEAALPLQRLLTQRLALENRQNPLPAKRRAELRTLLDQPPTPATYDAWSHRFSKLMRRIEETSSKDTPQQLKDALEALGSKPSQKNPAGWRKVTRSVGQYQGQGLLDLLAIWNYAQSFDNGLGQYE